MSTLLSRNADYSLKIKGHAQPLYIAAMKGHVKVVTMLIEARADVNATPLHKTTPLQIAIRNGFTDPTEATVWRNKTGKGWLPNPMDTSHWQHSQCYLWALINFSLNYIYMYIYIYIFVYTFNNNKLIDIHVIQICKYVCICIYTYIYIHNMTGYEGCRI